ncbi:hypothetical protein NKR23_g5225 [Pleurostoma richardsiae]|uniref:Uncharacterized protein n=1 Tax=Pleurostoma richardsiae TaxID=41990 RepID=A0AA38S2X9_9PEZI|nr:hypothetical protein NKR23_g5225 [Pleurostoma richardsiae]
MDDVLRYLRRNPALRARMKSGEEPEAGAGDELVCRTPPPSPSPVTGLLQSTPDPDIVRSPDRIRVPEEILAIYQNYARGNLESGALEWNVLHDVFRSFLIVARSVNIGESPEILKLLSPSFADIGYIIRCDLPDFLTAMLRLFTRLHQLKRFDIASLLSQYLPQLLRITLGRTRPITMQICQLAFEDLASRLGPGNKLIADLYYDYLRILLESHEIGNKEAGLRAWFESHAPEASGLPSSSVLRIYLAINLADWRMSQGEHAQAQAELRAVLDDEGLRDALYRDPYQLAMVHCAMAKVRWGAGELEQAEAAFREAVTVAEGWGRDKNITNSMLRDFEQFLAAQGRHVEAAELCKRRLEHLKKLVAEADEKEKKGKHGGGRSKSLVERDQQQRTMTEIQSLESKT